MKNQQYTAKNSAPLLPEYIPKKKLKIYGKTASAAFSNLRDRAAWATSLRIKSVSEIPRRPGDSIDWQAGDLMRGGG